MNDILKSRKQMWLLFQSNSMTSGTNKEMKYISDAACPRGVGFWMKVREATERDEPSLQGAST